jgi:anti-anti-sigma factor
VSTPAVTVTTEPSGSTIAVKLAGEIDLANADDVAQAVDAAITNQSFDAIIDVAGITYIDSVGMRYLFTLAARLNTAQIRLRFLAPLGTPARRVIELSGLNAVAPVDPPLG